MKPPKEMTRITKTRKPKHQFYQPGFNIHNGCWLTGAWVDVTQQSRRLRARSIRRTTGLCTGQHSIIGIQGLPWKT